MTLAMSMVLALIASATVSAADADAKEALMKSQRAQLEAKAYRIKMNTTSPGMEKGFSSTVEFVAPDRYHMVQPQMETIVVGPATYMKTAGQDWQKSPVDMGDMMKKSRDPKALEEQAKNMGDVKIVGKEKIDGVDCTVYEATSKVGETSTVSKVWVGNSDSLTRKVESESTLPNGKSKSTITYEYDSKIKIDAPTVK